MKIQLNVQFRLVLTTSTKAVLRKLLVFENFFLNFFLINLAQIFFLYENQLALILNKVILALLFTSSSNSLLVLTIIG